MVFSGIHYHEPNVENLGQFEIFESISSVNALDPIKSNEKRAGQLHSRKFCWKLIASKLDSGTHIPDRIWSPR
jgi:hypothetical protein